MGSSFDFLKIAKAMKKAKPSVSAKKRAKEDGASLSGGVPSKLGVVVSKAAKKPAAKKSKKVKPKAYKVAGSFSLDESGAVIKKTKAIHSIVKGKKGNEKEYAVTFLVKTNA